MQSRRLALIALTVLGSTGCAAQGVANEPRVGPMSDSADQGVEVLVRNGTSRNLRVYAVEGGEETLLGRVNAMADASVWLRNPMAGTIRLAAASSSSVRTSERHVSEPVQVLPGHQIYWELRTSPGSTGPRFSTVRVRPCPDAGC
ncbi:MAG: hypothetical protein GEU90_02975 [Gemmatimonas sp.]|nr:hypothetical protein [Gemmatimonas sp.]